MWAEGVMCGEVVMWAEVWMWVEVVMWDSMVMCGHWGCTGSVVWEFSGNVGDVGTRKQ